MNMGLPSTTDRDNRSAFWTISTTAMTEAEARGAASLIHQAYPEVFAHPVDPRHSLTVHMGRSTVELLRAAVARFTESKAEAVGIVEIFDEWLSVAAPHSKDYRTE
jgi:hypothetical protein